MSSSYTLLPACCPFLNCPVCLTWVFAQQHEIAVEQCGVYTWTHAVSNCSLGSMLAASVSIPRPWLGSVSLPEKIKVKALWTLPSLLYLTLTFILFFLKTFSLLDDYDPFSCWILCISFSSTPFSVVVPWPLWPEPKDCHVSLSDQRRDRAFHFLSTPRVLPHASLPVYHARMKQWF